MYELPDAEGTRLVWRNMGRCSENERLSGRVAVVERGAEVDAEGVS